MPTPKWLVVARNKYRIQTSGIRGIRPYFPYLIIGLLGVYVLFIAPAFVSFFIDEFVAFFLSQAAVAVTQIILFMIFVYCVVIPISSTLKEVETGQLEIFLAAPVRPSDVLLGEFLGGAPLYAIVITIIAGIFTAILNPLGLDVVQIAITVMTIVVMVLSALWIGVVISALLRTRLGKIARGKDIGKALSLVIVLPIIALIYAILGGGLLRALADPGASGTVKAILGLLPSSWGGEVIVGFASNPGNIAAVGFETLTRFGGLLAFFVGVLWLGAKAANRAYSLEAVTFTAPMAKPDGAFYGSVKHLGGGGSSGALLVSIFKDYSRRLENLSKIAYVVGVIALMNIFFGHRDDPTDVVYTSLMWFAMLAAFVAGDVTLRGKEALFIYKKAPSGVGRFVNAMLMKSWLVVLPIAATTVAVLTMLCPGRTFTSLLTNIGLMVLTSAGNVPFALGLTLLNPGFSRKPEAGLMLNAMIVVMVMVGLDIGLSILTDLSFFYTFFLVAVLSWVLGIAFLSLGKRNLSRIE